MLYKTIAQIASEGLGLGDRPDYISVKAMCVTIRKDSAVYTVNVTRKTSKSPFSSLQMCPEENCGKKVVDENNGTFRCEKCCKVYGHFKWAYMLSVEIADATGSQWVTVFGNEAEALLGITADALGTHKVNVGVIVRLLCIRASLLQKNDSAIDSIVRRATHRERLFKLRAKVEQFNVRDPNDASPRDASLDLGRTPREIDVRRYERHRLAIVRSAINRRHSTQRIHATLIGSCFSYCENARCDKLGERTSNQAHGMFFHSTSDRVP